MKNYINLLVVVLFVGQLSSSCEDFLDVPPDASTSEDFIFSNYNTFQGFLDNNYELISDPNNFCLVGSANMGCESIALTTASPVFDALPCNYLKLGTRGRSIWMGQSEGRSNPTHLANDGVYDFWPVGVRIANIALKKIDELAIKEKDSAALKRVEKWRELKGQAYFFRAYLHFQVLSAYGAIPYIQDVFPIDKAITIPRYYTVDDKKGYQATSELIAKDLEAAAQLLPVVWLDKEGQRAENDLGRITKGACLALLAKVYLFAGSPLMEEMSVKGFVSDGDTVFNKQYMERAAIAAARVMNLNEYSLTPFGSLTGGYTAGEGYREMFTTTNGNVPYTREIILKKWSRLNKAAAGSGVQLFNATFSRIYAKGPLASPTVTGGLENPLIEFMDKFEMKDGTQYKPGNSNVGGYDDNKQKFFRDRDPRFDFNYYLHDEVVGTFTCSFENQGKAYYATAPGPFLMTKFWFPGVDQQNRAYGKYLYSTPILRYADVLLMYAEAVFEATGDKSARLGGASISAEDALNEVRKRVSMPAYNPSTYAVPRLSHGEIGGDDPFRLAVRNERAVELAYEGHLWWDLRRWKRMHRMNKNVYILDFNKAFTTSSRILKQAFPFELKHYWLPFPADETQIYKGFGQNPGW